MGPQSYRTRQIRNACWERGKWGSLLNSKEEKQKRYFQTISSNWSFPIYLCAFHPKGAFINYIRYLFEQPLLSAFCQMSNLPKPVFFFFFFFLLFFLFFFSKIK
uniref:Uncharacterized protein n=1 Tax=Cacopsylla melanoneura TaxID=428564 RepID=A0A8D9A0T1_9HEMI